MIGSRLIFGLLVLCCANLAAQQPDAIQVDRAAGLHLANRISTDSIRAYLSVLAADSLEGRETGTLGQKKAARFIRSKFMQFGLSRTPSDSDYFQPFDLYSLPYDKVHVEIGDSTWHVMKEFYTFSALTDTVVSGNQFVFLGYGLSTKEYDNYGDGDYSGKIGVVFRGEPRKDGRYLLSGNANPSRESEISEKVRLAREKGLIALLIVQPNFGLYLPRVARYLRDPRLQLDKPTADRIPALRIGKERLGFIFEGTDPETLSEALAGGMERFDLQSTLPTNIVFSGHISRVRTENVIGYVKGSVKPNEYVYLTAHYDHLGKRGEDIYNGADDDGSGTSALLELARVYADAAKNDDGPKRSVVFLFFTGEEKGLLGSEYYTDHPLLPMENTVVDLNIDMIGRSDNLYGPDSTDYIYVIGSDRISKELKNISEEVNRKYAGLTLDYKYDDPNDPQRLYYRSDHYNFARFDVPVIFYFRGLHEDYHKPTDTIDKIEFDTIGKVARLVFLTSWNLANRELRIKSDF